MGTGCFRIKVRTDTAELTNMRIAGLRKWWDLIRKSKIFIKKTKVACRMSGAEWRVVYFRKLLLRNSVLEVLRVRRFADIQERCVSEQSGGGQYLSQIARMEREKELSRLSACFLNPPLFDPAQGTCQNFCMKHSQIQGYCYSSVKICGNILQTISNVHGRQSCIVDFFTRIPVLANFDSVTTWKVM